ncbi:MAG: low specificity L-threonine aldolase [Oscillospiraceae bacterium]|nr:low specificity L-threonine aldolase [Oscillospiraceae bacterium]
MITFENDYSCGAHPAVLQRLLETNLVPQPGYGADAYSENARQKIRAACACPDAEVFFLSGGTQTNAVVLASILQPWEGVIAAQTGHIHVHEAGAPEALGAKILPLPERLGKLDPGELWSLAASLLADENIEHMVYPGAVYISHPTEWGTLYTKAELQAISEVCKEFHMRLYLDGARLAYGLMAKDSDVDLPLIASLCDAFYIGGTKCGALCGEAVVFPQGAPAHFCNFIKKHGALMAKGRLCGVQFDALFTDGLYSEIGRCGVEMAERLKIILAKHKIPCFMDTPTNQQFAVLENARYNAIREKVPVGFWSNPDPGHTIVRFATAWYTTDAYLEALDSVLSACPCTE